jgi:hypothetical protein
MKKILALSTLFIMGCTVDNHPMAPQVMVNDMSLGTKSMSTVLVKVTNPSNLGLLTVTMTVTPGAMYSLQLTDIHDKVINSQGFTANTITLFKVLDFTALANGSYDLSLIDTSGNVSKIPLIIQH